MKETVNRAIYADRVQLAYAKTLDFVSHAVMLVMGAGYAFYLLKLLPLTVPVETVAGNWHLSASALQTKIHHHCGWSCFFSLETLLHGDALSYASVVLLAMATLICLVTAVSAFIREKNYPFVSIALLQVIVLLVAASGIMSQGH